MRAICSIVIAALALCLPSVASANTGSVACTDAGVVFTYHADFANDTIVTETVNGVDTQVTIKAHTLTTNTVAAPDHYVVASATWIDGTQHGSIPNTGIVCPNVVQTPTVCIPTETVTKTVYTPGPTVVQYIPYDVPGPTVTKTVTKYKTVVKWKTRIKLIKYTPVKPVKRPVRSGGVTG